MKDCIFCKITDGSEKSLKVFENEHTIAFAPNPNTIISKRHLIIAPKKHYENIYDISENELYNILKTTKFIS